MIESVLNQGDAPEYHDFDWDDDYVFVNPRATELRIRETRRDSDVRSVRGPGDAYAAGFSGYGRDRVEYFQCKSFSEPLKMRRVGRVLRDKSLS